MKFYVYRIAAPSAAPFSPLPSQIFSSSIHIYTKFHLFDVNFNVFNVNVDIFSEIPPPSQVPLGATRPLCSLGTPLGIGMLMIYPFMFSIIQAVKIIFHRMG